MSNIQLDITKLLVLAINKITNNEQYAYRAYQNAPQQPASGCSVFVHTFNDIGTHASSYVDVDEGVQETQETLTSIDVSLNFFRDNSFMNANSVRHQIRMSSIRNSLLDAGLTVVTTSSVRDLTMDYQTAQGYQTRHQLDLTLMTSLSEHDIHEAIDAIIIRGDFHSFSNQVTPITVDINTGIK